VFSFARGSKARDELWRDAQPAALSLQTKVRYEPGLLPRLVRDYDELESRFTLLRAEVRDDPRLAELAGQNCAARLHELRRREALWLYPVIACAIADDVDARRQFLQLRLAMLGLARRLLRRFDQLAGAVHDGGDLPALLDEIGDELTEYRNRNESEIFPLYELMGRALAAPAHSA
jgi:hypothetical protein